MLFGTYDSLRAPSLPCGRGSTRRCQAPVWHTQAARVFSTIVVEKVLDILTLLLFLGISLPFVGLPKELGGPAILLSVGVLALTVVIMVLVLKPDLARKLIHAIAGRLPARLGPRIEAAGDQVLQGLAPLSNPPIAAKLGFWSLATWAFNVDGLYLMLLAFNVVVTPMAAVVLVVVTNLSMTIPSCARLGRPIRGRRSAGAEPSQRRHSPGTALRPHLPPCWAGAGALLGAAISRHTAGRWHGGVFRGRLEDGGRGVEGGRDQPSRSRARPHRTIERVVRPPLETPRPDPVPPDPTAPDPLALSHRRSSDRHSPPACCSPGAFLFFALILRQHSSPLTAGIVLRQADRRLSWTLPHLRCWPSLQGVLLAWC